MLPHTYIMLYIYYYKYTIIHNNNDNNNMKICDNQVDRNFAYSNN